MIHVAYLIGLYLIATITCGEEHKLSNSIICRSAQLYFISSPLASMSTLF
jgi:hypothetical protein